MKVTVITDSKYISVVDYLKEQRSTDPFKAVIMTEYNTKNHFETNETNKYCRENNIPFLLAHISGCTSRILNDFGSSFKVVE